MHPWCRRFANWISQVSRYSRWSLLGFERLNVSGREDLRARSLELVWPLSTIRLSLEIPQGADPIADRMADPGRFNGVTLFWNSVTLSRTVEHLERQWLQSPALNPIFNLLQLNNAVQHGKVNAVRPVPLISNPHSLHGASDRL